MFSMNQMIIRGAVANTGFKPVNAKRWTEETDKVSPYFEGWIRDAFCKTWQGALEIALIVLWARQTPQERQAGATFAHNNMGACKAHGEFLAYYTTYIAFADSCGRRVGTALDLQKILGGVNRRTIGEEALSVVAKHIHQIDYALRQVETGKIAETFGPMFPEMVSYHIGYCKAKGIKLVAPPLLN